MEPITLIAIGSAATLLAGLALIAKRKRAEVSRKNALIAKAKERARQKISVKDFEDTAPLSDFEFGTRNKIADDRHLGYGALGADEDRIINAIFDDSLAPPLKVRAAYTVHGSFVDSIFNDANISETIEPRFGN